MKGYFSLTLLLLMLFQVQKVQSQETEKPFVENVQLFQFLQKNNIPVSADYYFFVAAFGCRGCNHTIINKINTLALTNKTFEGKNVVIIVESSIAEGLPVLNIGTTFLLNSDIDDSGLDVVNILFLKIVSGKIVNNKILYKQNEDELKQILFK